MNSVERGRWKLVSITSTASKAIARRDEQRGLAGERPDAAVLARGALEQPQRGRADRDDAPARAPAAALSASAVSALTAPRSACIRWSGGIVGLTGRNVPAPDMQRHAYAARCRARASRASSASVKCRPAVGAATEPSSAQTWSGSRRGPARRARGARRCRAAAACRHAPRSPGRAPARETRRRASPRRPRPCASTVASSWPRKQTLPSSPKRTTSPGCEPLCRLHERAPARAVEPPVQGRLDRRLAAPRPMRRPSSRAGITLVSLTTSASPGAQQVGQDRASRGPRVPAPRPAAPRAAARRRAATSAAARCVRPADRNRKVGAHRRQRPLRLLLWPVRI